MDVETPLHPQAKWWGQYARNYAYHNRWAAALDAARVNAVRVTAWALGGGGGAGSSHGGSGGCSSPSGGAGGGGGGGSYAAEPVFAVASSGMMRWVRTGVPAAPVQ